jgi:O-antigen ligase
VGSRAKSFDRKVLTAIGIGVLVFLVFQTGSRAGLIGIVLILAVGLGLYIVTSPLRGLPVAIIAALLAILVVLAMPILIGSPLEDVLHPVFGAAGTAESDQLRQDLTWRGIHYFQQSRYLGFGAGSFEVLSSRDNMFFGRATNAHNTFIELAAQYGIVVVVPLFTCLGFALVQCNPFAKHSLVWIDPVRCFQILAGLIAIVVGGLDASSLVADSSWWLLIGFVLALVWSAANPSDDCEGQPDAASKV